MRALPISIKQANQVIDRIHRHCEPVQGGKFAIGLTSGKAINPCGAAICGRPAARMLDDWGTLQVSRLAVPEAKHWKNACSFLLGRCCRVAAAMGYEKVVTYTLGHEGGASLRAAGFKVDGEVKAGGVWSSPNRPRDSKPETDGVAKVRWAKELPRGDA